MYYYIGIDGFDSKIKDILADIYKDRIYACIIGSIIGDACGSYHEFSFETIDEENMKKCMEMLGGGPHKCGPG